MADSKFRRISTLGSRFTSLVSVALVLVLLGLAAMLAVAGANLTDNLRRNLGFVIKMERDCPESAVNTVKQALLANRAVERISFESAEQILQQESEYLGEDLTAMLDANPYAAEFDIKVKPQYSSPDSIEALSDFFGDLPSVDEIVTESAVIEGIDTTLRRSSLVLLGLAVVLLVVSLALINNAVSLSIYSRRFVIHTMKLVGATRSFIRRPFLQASATNGIIAGIVAGCILCGLRFYAGRLDPAIDAAIGWTATAAICLALLALGASICLLTALFATNRYLRASYDEMFLK